MDGTPPSKTGFDVEGKSERRDRSHHAPVVEMYGFLHLHRMPFQNSVNKKRYEEFKEPGDESVYDWLHRVGERTRRYVEEHGDTARKLAGWFRELADDPPRNPELRVEGIRLDSVARAHPEDVEAQVETKLIPELNEAARERARALSDAEAATAMLHILLDGAIYTEKKGAPAEVAGGRASEPAIEWPTPEPAESALVLPESLRPAAEDALGYLRAGYHVLFAGPPGTGKTTVGQLVGHAWNANLTKVPDELALAEAPTTTVGNSAWAPFHTIGGILPDESGKFVASRGIFIDPEFEQGGEWQLRPECIVLDEMNRADLDRCIGELYPLLSRSVGRVHPAGIPRVRSIRAHERFRILATVNDATLDDIVFPISEGLARRFVRIELWGATDDDLALYLEGKVQAHAERRCATRAVLEDLFEACEEEGHMKKTELGQHLPFGVGYFATLRAWVRGELELSQEFSERDFTDQARILMQTALRGAVRVRGFDGILARLASSEDSE